MGQQTRVTAGLTSYERDRLFGWGEDIFGVQHLALEWQPKDRHLILDEGGEPISHVGILTHTITVHGTPLLVGGVGGVVTRPEHQGQGYGQLAMRATHHYLCHDLHVPFGLLFCLTPLQPLYMQLGWQPLGSPLLIDQSTGKRYLPSALHPMLLPCDTLQWPSGDIDLASPPW